MTTVSRRLCKLEDQFRPAGWKPPKRFRLVLFMACTRRSLEGATCKRSIWPDGTLCELVRIGKTHEGAREVPDDEFEEWITSFPVEGL
jgi:hypothetical protein